MASMRGDAGYCLDQTPFDSKHRETTGIDSRNGGVLIQKSSEPKAVRIYFKFGE